MKIKYPPTKKSTMEEYEERERRIPGGPISPMEDNPRAQEHYRRLIAAGIEDADEYPFLMDGSINPKNRTPLRERRWGDEGNTDDNIKAWNIRNRSDTLLRKKGAAKKDKPKRTIKKKVTKNCKCK